MGKPTTVVFDVGNVLLRWDPRNLYRKVFTDETQMEWFLSTVCTSQWNIEQDRGRDWEEAVAVLVKDHPAHEIPIRAFHDRWEETVSGVIDDNVI
jgi:2-haloacid dehalogenase